MEVVEIDAFESGGLSTKVNLSGRRGPNSALLRVNVLPATDDVSSEGRGIGFGRLDVGDASLMVGCGSSTMD